MSSSEQLLSVEGLSVTYETVDGPVTAVDDIGFELHSGEVIGIVGESGSGKSSIARALLGTLGSGGKVVGGAVSYFGQAPADVADPGMLRRLRGARIGFVPQNPFACLNPVLSLEKQFRNAIRAHHPKSSKSEVRKRAVAAMRRVSLNDPEALLRARANELSGGMKQRVVIALATCLDPPLIVADEPTTGLDVISEQVVMELLRSLVQKSGCGLMLVTHDLPLAAAFCDRLIVMRSARVVESGDIRSIIDDPQQSYTQELIRDVSMLAEGRVDELR